MTVAMLIKPPPDHLDMPVLDLDNIALADTTSGLVTEAEAAIAPLRTRRIDATRLELRLSTLVSTNPDAYRLPSDPRVPQAAARNKYTPRRDAAQRLHPLPDGNGRLARALIQAILARRDVLDRPLVPFGPVLRANARQHAGTTRLFATAADWNAYVSIFARAALRTAHAVLALAKAPRDNAPTWCRLSDKERKHA